jgi:hypothetical protein
VTRGWLLLDPALRQTQLGTAARRAAGAVKQAAAEMVAEAPRSAVAAARAEAASPAPPAAAAQPASLQSVPAPGVSLDSVIHQVVTPEAAASPDEPAVEALAGSFLERAEPQPAVTEQAPDAAEEIASLQSKLDDLSAAAEARAAEAERLAAALAAERESRAAAEQRAAALAAEAAERLAAAEAARRLTEAEAARRLAEAEAARRRAEADAARRLSEAQAQLAAQQAAAEKSALERAAVPAAPAPPPLALVPPVVDDEPAAVVGRENQRQLFLIAAVLIAAALIAVVAVVVVLFAVVLWRRGRSRVVVAEPVPLLLTAPAADGLALATAPEVSPPAVPQAAPEPPATLPRATLPRAAPQRGRPVRVNGVAPPTAEAKAAMKAAGARHEAARSGVAAPAADPGSEADTAVNPIVTALRKGNLPLFELLFGELTDLRAPQLQRIVYGGRGEDLAIVCRAVGVDKLLFGAIFMLTDHLRGGAAEEEPERTAEMLRMYDRMPPATARKVLAKWQSNWSGGARGEPVSDV